VAETFPFCAIFSLFLSFLCGISFSVSAGRAIFIYEDLDYNQMKEYERTKRMITNRKDAKRVLTRVSLTYIFLILPLFSSREDYCWNFLPINCFSRL